FTLLPQERPLHSSDLGTSPEHGGNLQKRQARVTVKYNRKELQRRLDVEKWIDDCLNELYLSKEDMPDEVNIDDLIDLPSNEERVKNYMMLLCVPPCQTFIGELVVKLEGLHKQEKLATEGIEHPSLCNHPQHRHEPYHFNDPHCPRTHTHTHQTL
uniref:Protein phosphatase 1, regulatory (inhibitor) subunit 14Aa n=1 Tax=Oncorhynchus kisutch TaxID=8019 RepID=A0A8C7KT15_ONCKI